MASKKKGTPTRGEGSSSASASAVLLISEKLEAQLETLLACNVIAHLNTKDDSTLPTWLTKEQFYVQAIELEIELANAGERSYRRHDFDRRRIRTSMRLPLKLSKLVSEVAGKHGYTSADFVNAALARHIERYYQAVSDRGLGDIEKRIRSILKGAHTDAGRSSEKDLNRLSASAED